MLHPVAVPSSSSRFVLTAKALLLAAAVTLAVGAQAQAPIALPYTATTVAGGGAAITTGATCTTGSQYKAADTYGNGCPGLFANFNADTRGGIVADGQGNVYIADSSNNMIRKYDPKTGVVSRVAGKGTNCTTGLLDSNGDGCPALQTSFSSTPRGIGIDPYGNVLFAGYGTQMVHIICEAASPLCLNTTGTKQVGYMYRIAGCVGTVGGAATAGSGTTAGSEGDGTAASPYANLSGDVTNNGGTVAGGACSGSVGEINQARGVNADKWGNVYIGETALGRWRIVLGPQTSTYFSGNNPLWAIIALNPNYPSPHQGYIYPLLNGFAAKTSGGITYNIITAAASACQSGTGASTAVSTDAYGDGCQYFATAPNTNTSNVQGVAADNYGNVYFADANAVMIRVIYAGGANASANPLYAALTAEGVTAPQTGFVYTLVGGTSTGISTTPALGNTIGISSAYKVAIGPNNNILIGDTGTSSVEMLDITTGYARTLFKSGSACAAHVTGTTNGDGCPAGSFSFSASNGLGVASDPLGNTYIMDQNALLRKIEAVSLVPTIVGSTTAASAPLTQTLKFHGPVGTASMTATVLNAPADITVGSVTCAAAAADNTMDCTVPVTFAPTQPGTRTANLAVTVLNASSAVLGSQVFPVSATATGSALVADLATPSTTTVSSTSAGAVAVDGAGNIYTVSNTDNTVRKNGATTVGTAPASILQLKVDTAGNVYATATGASAITKYTLGIGGTYTTSTISSSAIALPQAVVVDQNGNLYVADKSTGSVFEIAAGSTQQASQPTVAIATGFTNPASLTLDGAGNLFVADRGVGIQKIAFVNGVPTTTLYAAATGGAITVPSLAPLFVAADAAGNVYVQDATSNSVLSIPVNQTGPVTTTVLTGLTTPAGLAVDGNGVVYSADAGTSTLTMVNRNAGSYSFGTNTSTVIGALITNAGNLTATGYQAGLLDSAEFPITSVSPTNCYANASIIPGYACSVTTQFTPGSGTGNVQSVLAYTLATATTGSLTFTATKNGAAVTTTTTIGAQTPTSPVYAASATEVTFPVTVAASDSSTPTGTVNITVDTNTPYAVTLSGGAVNVPLSGLTAGSHTITAAYPTQAGLTGSTSTTVNFSIAQATTTVNWTPATTTQQYSAAIGNAVLNAAAVITGSSTAVPGYYLYTATPSGGSASTVHAASFLPIGTYALGVTFVPTDTVDYVSSTATVATYTVTKATTSAPIGASQLVVASDGTGNYTNVQAAVNAIPATGGGSVYIKPGIYTGNITVVQPNVSLRGLGGDPTAVVLTHSGGAFGGSGIYAYAGEFTSASMNGAQLPSGSSLFTGDEGSATLVVAKGINTAASTATLIPNNFYAENLTLANTYDSDNTTTTTTYLPAANSGTCTANEGPAMTYFALYNASKLCASQALAIWITSDLAVMNNVYTTSLQDTIYAGSQGAGSNGYVPSRQYWFRGKVTGNVDYIFGDAAAVFDYSSIYSVTNKTAGTYGTIEAQNKATQTGSTTDYLSGYVMNANVFTTSGTGAVTYFGRPYGTYSTWIMLNSYVDSVNPLGYEEFSGSTTNLPTSTYDEFNNLTYTDPATNAPDLNGIPYLGTGGNSGTGVTGTRETVSTSPGTPMASNAVKTSMTAAQATLYYPAAFLGQTVSALLSNTATFSPTTALAANVNAFVPTATPTTITYGNSLTVLMRPATPGLGAITNGAYTIPTGTYTLYDNGNSIATGSLDASGEASFTSTALTVGAHNFTWTYSGDSNFSGSTTSTALVVTVTGRPTTTTLGLTASPITYGQSAALNATVSPQSGSGTPTGNVTATVDSTTSSTTALSSGAASFTFSGLNAGTHSFVGTYAGDTTFAGSTSTALGLTVNQATLTATGQCANRIYGAANTCTATVTGYQYTDSAATVFTGTPTGATTATRLSPAGNYPATPLSSSLALTPFGTTNYTVTTAAATSFTITGGAAQFILFSPLPNFAHGASYQLTARATSGLPVTYSVTTGGGIASISGTTLTVTGTGTVTVQANCTDASGNYTAANPVSQTFTAQ